MLNSLTKSIVFFPLILVLFLSYSANPPQGRTGAPGEQSCAAVICHSGNNLLIQGEIEIEGLPIELVPSTTYSITVRLTQSSGPLNRGGFQMVALDDSDTNFGVLSNPGLNSTISEFNNRSYFEHQPAKNFDNQGVIEYNVDWTSPAAWVGNNAIFYIAANFTNGNAARTGDRIVLHRDTLQLSEVNDLNASISVTEEGCYTGDSTLVESIVSGGLLPYRYKWSTGATSATIIGSNQPSYQLTVTDQGGDSVVTSVEIDTVRLANIEFVDSLVLYVDENGQTAEISIESLTEDENCLDLFEVSFSQSSFLCDQDGISKLIVHLSSDNSADLLDSIYIVTLDTIAPNLLCVTDILAISTCAPFSYPVPIVSDNCGIQKFELVSGLGPNETFPEGLSLEIYRARDFSGNTRRCTIFIQNELFLDLNLEITNISCHGETDGSIVANINGSNPPFQVGIGPELHPLESLAPGPYDLTIIDHSGCIFTRSVLIEEPDSLHVDEISVRHSTSTEAGDGEIDVTISGGSPPYSYEWFTEDESFSTAEDLDLLFPGNYILDVTDARGCTIGTDSIQIETITAVDDVAVADFVLIWPNPASHFLMIQSSLPSKSEFHVVLRSIEGNKVHQGILKNHEVISLDNLPEGMYFVEIRKNTEVFLTKKLVILH